MIDILRRVLVLREAGVLVALILIMLFFGLSTTTFFTTVNLTNVLRQSAVLGIMTMAVTFLIISGEFDLSIGSTFALSAVMGTVMMERGFPMVLAFLLALVLSAVVGAINGVIVTKLKIPSFIATLGTMMIIRSAVLMASQRRPRVLSDRGLISCLFGGGQLFGIIPVPILWLLGVVIVSWIVLAKTPFGYKVYATGGNIQAARLSGINTDRIKITNFVLTAFAAGLAGLISLCFLRMVAPVQGEGYELEAIAATVIGGTSLGGGVGSILGAFIGSFMLATIKNGLVLVGTDPYLQKGVLGLVILIAVVVNIRLGAARSNYKALSFLKRLRRGHSSDGAAPPKRTGDAP